MDEGTCLHLTILDRLGLGGEVLGLISRFGINLLAMEANTKGMFLKMEGRVEEKLPALEKALRGIEGILAVHRIENLPYEEREQQLQTILEAAGEGVLATDARGRVTHLNSRAAAILNLAPGELRGRSLETLSGGQIPVTEVMRTGRRIDHREARLPGGAHFVFSATPIRERGGGAIGTVIVLKDIAEVRQLVRTFARRSQLHTFQDIVYQSALLHQVISTARMVAKTDSTVLLRGETGSGKELFAQAIHMESPRYAHPFVPVNCAGLPESLLESELFGYEEGAFTGARRGGKPGLLEAAQGGTIFLDEVGEVSPRLQALLLRTLQEGTIRRVGGTKEIPVDVRFLAATNRDLEEMVMRGEFRQDLYYRLNVIPLLIPPLRERREDIPVLAGHLLARLARRLHRRPPVLSPEALTILLEHPWPGNVRELENVLERAANLAPGDIILAEHIRLDPAPRSCPTHTRTGDTTEGESEVRPLKTLVEEVERRALQRALRVYGSSRKAGEALGVSGTTVLNKMKKYGLRAPVIR